MDNESPFLKPDAYGGSPFSSAVEDALQFYFFNFWCKYGAFPPVDGLHDRLHTTEWIKEGMCPGIKGITDICEQLKGRIC